MKIGIYGGSFNPPHNGHRTLAFALQKKLSLQKIVVIPSNVSPQKENNGNVDPQDRLNMCKKVFSASCFDVSDCEIRRGGKSYTVDTLTWLRTQYPGAEFYLFMGSDMLLSFHTWYRYRDILDMCTVCAVSRRREDTPEVMRSYVCRMLPGQNVRIFAIEPFEVSSSQIRERIRNGENCETLLDKEILEYIKDRQLYGYSRI